MIRSLAFSVLTTAAPVPIVVHLSPTQTCPAESMQWDANGLTIIGLACAGDLVFYNGFELGVKK
jgi:hypothetical protein